MKLGQMGQVEQLPSMLSTTKDLTTIQIKIQQQGEEGHIQEQIQEVKVKTHLIRRIGLFNDLLQFVTEDNNKIIPFPAAYSEVAVIYINFINVHNSNQSYCNILKDIEVSSLLCQALKLCHYLDDTVFLKFLVSGMQSNLTLNDSSPTTVDVTNRECGVGFSKPWSCYHDMITSLPDNLQRDIYLLTPYALIPDCYQNNQSFLELWINTNIEVTSNVTMHMIDNEYISIQHVLNFIIIVTMITKVHVLTFNNLDVNDVLSITTIILLIMV